LQFVILFWLCVVGVHNLTGSWLWNWN
jgi:hypothetical protein